MITGVSCALAAALALAAAQAKSQMHDIGHKRDQKTILAGMKDFTPPFLGTNVCPGCIAVADDDRGNLLVAHRGMQRDAARRPEGCPLALRCA
jgi:hypothetical protein